MQQLFVPGRKLQLQYPGILRYMQNGVHFRMLKEFDSRHWNAFMGISRFARRSNRGWGGKTREFPQDWQVTELDRTGSAVSYVRSKLAPEDPIPEYVKARATRELSRPPFIHFTLRKSGIDLQVLINKLEQNLKLTPGSIRHAGTTEKNAVTLQRLSIPREAAMRDGGMVPILDAAKDIPLAVLGDFKYEDNPVSTENRTGCNYKVTIRNVKTDHHTIRSDLEGLKETGFANYYGEHELAKKDPRAGAWMGCRLLRRNCREAVEHFLLPVPSDSGIWSKVKKRYLKTSDPVQSLKIMEKQDNQLGTILRSIDDVNSGLGFIAPPGEERPWKVKVNSKFNEEVRIFSASTKVPDEFWENLLAKVLPFEARRGCIEVYNMCMWNRMLSRRLETWGINPKVGDFVMPEGELRCIRSESEALEFSPAEVLLPTLGYDMPEAAVDLYKNVLTADGISAKSFEKDSILPEGIKSTWRPAVQMVEGLQYNVKSVAGKRSVEVAFNIPNGCFGSSVIREINTT